MTALIKQVADAAAGLAYEMELFTRTGLQIGMWSAQSRGLVCPAAYERRDGFLEAKQNSQARGWPVHLRPTGGGTVPQGPGVDNLALAFNPARGTSIEDGYRLLTDIIKQGFGSNGGAFEAGDTPGSFCDGAWNLSVEGRKIVGTAQRWRPNRGGHPRVLAHALFLTTDTYAEGSDVVSAFHCDLGLSPVARKAHTSLEAAFGSKEFPTKELYRAAQEALTSVHIENN
ncbi:MAG: hypothetical protein OXC60_18995 [Litoreibacter sp.]|nr:hypothetical protein [Litoreibacter sp.]